MSSSDCFHLVAKERGARLPAPRGKPVPSPHAEQGSRKGAMARVCRRGAGNLGRSARWVGNCLVVHLDLLRGAGGPNEQRDPFSLFRLLTLIALRGSWRGGFTRRRSATANCVTKLRARPRAAFFASAKAYPTKARRSVTSISSKRATVSRRRLARSISPPSSVSYAAKTPTRFNSLAPDCAACSRHCSAEPRPAAKATAVDRPR
jgi:hypothetical protein